MSDKNLFEENFHLLLFQPTQQSFGQAKEDMQGQRKTGRLVLLKAGMIMFLLKMFFYHLRTCFQKGNVMDLLREVEVFVKDHLGYVELPVLEVSYCKSVVIEKI